MGPRNHVLDWGPNCPKHKGNFGGKDMPDDTVVSCAKMVESIEMPFGVWTWVCPRNHVLDGCTLAPPGEYH